MAVSELGLNQEFQIYNADGTPFHNLVLHKAVVDSVVMSLGDKITGDVYYKDNTLAVTMREYIEYNSLSDGSEEPIKYYLVNPPTIVREGMVADNSDLKGMTKYSFEFYHPMYLLSNFPFSDVAVSFNEERYLSENKSFYWIGKPQDFINKLNKNLEGTQWVVVMSENFPQDQRDVLSDVLHFDNNSIADALKQGYDTWGVPYIVGQIRSGEPNYANGKRFEIIFGMPSNEIYESQADRDNNEPFVFRFGQGVGLKNNSRTPRNNKIITRIAGYGSEDNIPYGYPQIQWYGNKDWEYTLNNDPSVQDIVLPDGRVVSATSYPIYDGIVGGKWVRLIKHPFTRTHLMPTVYTESVFNKVSPWNSWDGGTTPPYNITLSQLLHDVNTRIETEENAGVRDAYNALITALNTVAGRALGRSTSLSINSPSGASPSYDGIVRKNTKGLISGNLTIYTESIRELEFESVLVERHYQSSNANYDPTRELIDYYDAIPTNEYPYPNPINPEAPSYEIHEFEKIKPELNVNDSITIIGVQPINADMTDADTWVDDIDDDGNFLQSYFRITLPVLSFDLYACAAITQEMQINMRSGACLGCTFVVQVNWDDYKSSFYDANGNFMPDGSQRDLTKFPNSTQAQISVVVQKDNSTFGTIMPNIYQHPAAGDEIVFLGISLPLSYIKQAEEKLDEEMKGYMLQNNVYYFDYPLKFDEHFLATHVNILSQIRTNTIINFAFGDQSNPLALAVKQLTIKYGDNPLPQYDITLTDNVEVVLNQIGQVAEGVERLGSLISILRDSINKSPITELNKKLSRVSDDTAQGLITFNKGANFGTFVHGQFGGMGANIDNKGNMEADTLVLRESLTVPTLVFNRAEVIAGTQTQTPFGGEIEEVIPQQGDYGWARLRLEDGDVGRIRVGALCMGYFHNYGENKNETNAVADSDDRRGSITWQGFSTVYFNVIEIPPTYDRHDNTDKAWFRYKLREQEDGGNGIHPFVHMTFAGRGYVRQDGEEYADIKQYQAFTIRTPFYTARLVDVGRWEWEIINYTYVNGMLDGFGEIVNNPSLTGFGTIDMSVWIKGHITQVENTPDNIYIEQSGLGFIAQNETQTVWVRVMDGYRNNHTSAYTYKVYRGDSETPMQKTITVTNDEASFVITYADMGNSELVEFRVVATLTTDEEEVLEETFEVRKTVDPNVVIPDRYEIELTDAAIHFDKDKNRTPSDIKIRVVCIHGDGTREYVGGNYVASHALYAWMDGSHYNIVKDYAIAQGVNYHLLSNVLDSEGTDIGDATVPMVKILLASDEIDTYEATGGYDGTITMYNGDSDVLDVVDSKTIPFLCDGQDGSAGLVADFDDEMISIPVDSTGVSGTWEWTTVAHLWLGMGKLQLKPTIEVVNSSGLRIASGYPTLVDGTDATIKITGFTTTDIESKKLQLRLTSNDDTYTGICTAYVNKIPAGEGNDAVIYQLSIDTTTVKKADSSSVPTPQAINVTIKRTSGTETTYHAYNEFVNNADAPKLTIYTKNDAKSTSSSKGSQLTSGSVYTTSANEYIHIAMWDNNDNLVDAETIPILMNGEKGSSTIVADFDDDMMQVPCNQDGTMIGSLSWTATAHLYNGSTAVPLLPSACSVVSNNGLIHNGINIARTSNTTASITITGFQEDAPDVCKLKIRLTSTTAYGSISGECTLTVSKVRQGRNGKSIVYQLLPDVTAVKVSKGGQYSATGINPKVREITYGTEGDVDSTREYWAHIAPTYFEGRKVQYSYDGGSWNDVSSLPIYVKNGSTVYAQQSIELRLVDSSNKILDVETIPIVADGKDGSMRLKYSSATKYSDPNATITPSDWHDNFQQGDIYAVSYDDNTQQYGTPFRIVGEKGDGGEYMNFTFNISRSLTSALQNYCFYSIWQDAPVATTSTYPYLWMKTTPMIWDSTLNDGAGDYKKNPNKEEKYARITGEKGQDGEDGVKIFSTSVTYAVTYSTSQPSDSSFTYTSIPSLSAGQYLWTKTVVEYDDGTVTKTYSVSKIGSDGTGAYISSTVTTYALTTSSNQPSTFNLTTRPTDIPKGYYLWTKTVITFSDGTSVATYSFSYNAKDGEDSAAYDFTRFSNDARLVNGVWTGTFTDADSQKVTDAISSQGDSRNLVRNGDYNNREQRTIYNQSSTTAPVGWTGNGSNQSSSSYVMYGTSVDSDGVTWMTWRNRTEVNYDGICQMNNASNPEYLVPITAGTTYTFRMKYKTDNSYITSSKPSGISCIIHFLTNAGQNATSQASNMLTITQRGTYDFSFDFTVPTGQSIQYGRVIICQASSKCPDYHYSYTNYVTKVQIQKKSGATVEFIPAPEDEFRGTKSGLWRGTLHWKYPHASTRFSDYEWSKIRDAEPRMTQWDNPSSIQTPDYNSGDSGNEQLTFYSGSYGERYYDMACVNDTYYICKKTYVYNTRVNGSQITPNNTNLWSLYWEESSSFNFLTTNTMYAARAYINNLGVTKLSTISNAGQITAHDGILEVFNSNGFRNIRFGIDENGYAVMQYYDNDGTLLYDLGPNGLSALKVRNANVFAQEWALLSLSSSDFSALTTRANLEKLFSTGNTATTCYFFVCKLVNGVATNDGVYITNNADLSSTNGHYFWQLNTQAPKISTSNYLADGYYYVPVTSKFGTAKSNIQTWGFTSEQEDFTRYKSSYAYPFSGVTWPSSSQDIQSDPLIYVEVYNVRNGLIQQTIKVFTRVSIYNNDSNIRKAILA